MKDEIKEIKEILYKMEDISYNYKANFLELHYKDVKILLDYITNLQEENEKLRKSGNELLKENEKILNHYAYDTGRMIDYKQRIDRAIEIYEKEGSIKYKKIRFYKNKPTKTLMYEALQGSDKDDK